MRDTVTNFLTETVASNKGVVGLVTATFGSTAATLLDWIPGIVSVVAAIVGIVLSVVVIRIKLRADIRNAEKHKLEMAVITKQLKE